MFSNGLVSIFAGLAVLSGSADAYWRMSCPGTVFTGRLDPIVSPGGVSGHTHIVLGGNGFAPNMTYESTQKSTCTSCTIKGDLSNYWTPMLYYHSKNGTFEAVPIAGGGQGGTVYYQQRAHYKGSKKITAFPKGFRMLAGTPSNREVNETDTTQKAVNFACLDYSGKTHYPEGELLPKVSCPNGVRAQVYFPQCWDGKNLDSPDHKSHMAYPDGYNGGECPDSHPVPTMGLFYEFLYDTGKFDFWAPDGVDQPFVFSMGDPTGRGFHGDFLSGWDVDILQNGIDKKTTDDAGCAGDVTCQGIFEYPDVYGTECSLPPMIDEQITGSLSALPGCNPVSVDATDDHKSECNAPTKLAVQTSQVYTDMTSQGWKYLGCANDTNGANVLPTKVMDSSSMTVETCIKACGDKGFSFAGLEYSSQCFCGNSAPSGASSLPAIGKCRMPCKGDSKQTCGDASRLSLYQSCKGSDCKNAFVGFIGDTGDAAAASGGSSPNPPPTNSPAPAQPTAEASSSASSSSETQPPSHDGSDSDSKSGNGHGSEPTDPPSSTSSPMPVESPPSSPAPSSVSSPSSSSSPSQASSSGSSDGGSGDLPDGWTAAGCFTDDPNNRALQGIKFAWWGKDITSSNCAAYCASKKFSMAGTEFGGQCFCGNQLDGGAKKTDDGKCNMKCKGDASQTCGGSGTLSVVSTKVTRRRRSLSA